MDPKLKLAGNTRALMTMVEYCRIYEPGMLALLLDVDAAVSRAVDQAEQITHDFNLLGDPVSGRYPPIVWSKVFP